MEDAKNCMDMALAMRQQMTFLRERWVMGYAPLHIRMGVSTGYCHVGNYGAVHRMAYTIVQGVMRIWLLVCNMLLIR